MTKEEIAKIVTDGEQAEAIWQLFEGERMETEAAMGKLAAENDRLKEAVAGYEAEKAERAQAAAEARARQALEKRFDKAVGSRMFVHELVRQGVMADFASALADPENEGRGDRELLDALTRDQGYFAVQCPAETMAGIGDVPAADVDRMNDAEYYEAMRKKKR